MEEGRTVALQGEGDQPMAQFHIVAMKNWKIQIFNLTNRFIYFVEVPLNITIFCQLVLGLSEQSQTVFVHYPSVTASCIVQFWELKGPLSVKVNTGIKPGHMQKLLVFPQ